MGASHNSQRIDAPVSRVFAQLLDATSYPEWLVGAQAITHVDERWPSVGASFHHRIGAGPLRLPGSTTIVELVPDKTLVLRAGMGPLGEAEVRFALEPDGAATLIEMDERPSRGIVKLTDRVSGPVVPMMLWGRNHASMDQFVELAERPARH
ncbi:MAG: SRPBCC family protein [Actinomycetota bacterium]|nr:SRPBCC family protein [Actinomycetota bacterium]